jgi:hypothetical protein
VKKLSQDAVLDAREALEAHQVENKPRHTDTSKLNDWTNEPGRTTAPRLSLASARAARHAEIAAAQANAKPAPPQPTVEEQHQQLVQRRRDSASTQKFNRQSFSK